MRLRRIVDVLLSVLTVLFAERRGTRVIVARVRLGRSCSRNRIVESLELHRARIRCHGQLRENHRDDAEQADKFSSEASHDDRLDLNVDKTLHRHNSLAAAGWFDLSQFGKQMRERETPALAGIVAA